MLVLSNQNYKEIFKNVFTAAGNSCRLIFFLFFLLSLFPLLRSCVAGRSLAGSTAWLTSAPACHSSRAACPKSGWPRLPYSPASARSSTEEESWRRRRMLPPPPPWPPCRPAHPHPPPAPPPCLAIPATSPGGRKCQALLRGWGLGGTRGWNCGQEAELPQHLMSPATAKMYLPDCPRARHWAALGKNVSQVTAAMIQSGVVEWELSPLTKAGSSLSKHGWWITTSHPKSKLCPPQVSFIISPAKSQYRMEAGLFVFPPKCLFFFLRKIYQPHPYFYQQLLGEWCFLWQKPEIVCLFLRWKP